MKIMQSASRKWEFTTEFADYCPLDYAEVTLLAQQWAQLSKKGRFHLNWKTRGCANQQIAPDSRAARTIALYRTLVIRYTLQTPILYFCTAFDANLGGMSRFPKSIRRKTWKSELLQIAFLFDGIWDFSVRWLGWHWRAVNLSLLNRDILFDS